MTSAGGSEASEVSLLPLSAVRSLCVKNGLHFTGETPARGQRGTERVDEIVSRSLSIVRGAALSLLADRGGSFSRLVAPCAAQTTAQPFPSWSFLLWRTRLPTLPEIGQYLRRNTVRRALDSKLDLSSRDIDDER